MSHTQTAQRPRMSQASIEKLGLKTIEEVREEAVSLGTTSPLVVDKPGVLAGAAAAWMSMTFLLCYVFLPLTRQALGLRYGSAPSLVEEGIMLGGSLAAFGVALATVVGGIALTKPKVSLEVSRREPVIAATLGGLMPWAILHNTLPSLVPFAEMGGGALLSFLAVNLLESAMFGVMLASFTRSPGKAFGLGFGFQILFMTLGVILTQIALFGFF